ncbi:glycosyltransferase [Microbacterium sp. HMH0099]|uniref:glycosyltransferase n=1 Tax=Microbacterium sp. HMH0099 TaxID=3414026 RepID=UPI003BF6E958
MDILLISDDLPTPTNSGNRLVLASEIDALAQKHQLRVVAFHHHGESTAASREWMANRNIPAMFIARRSLKTTLLKSPLTPYQSSSRHIPEAALTELAGTAAPQAIIANHEWSISAARQVQAKFADVSIILRSHNDERAFMRDVARSAKGVRGLYSALESARTSYSFIRRASASAAEVWALTEEDSAMYARLGSKSAVIPPIAAISGTHTAAATVEKRTPNASSFGFFGALDIPHTVSGLLWFIEHVWPTIRASADGAKFTIAGRRASLSVAQRLGSTPGINYLGEIESDVEFFSKCRIFVNPIFGGSGINMKMLQPASLGIPIVTTSVGRRGLAPLRLDAFDTAASFADACVRLSTDASLWNEQSAAVLSGSESFSEDAFMKLTSARLQNITKETDATDIR